MLQIRAMKAGIPMSNQGCQHENAVLEGSFSASGGEVGDNIIEVCPNCGWRSSDAKMKKDDWYDRLVELGRQYGQRLSSPYVARATKADLEKRCKWAERALQLKPNDPCLSLEIFRAAWSTNYLDPKIAEITGLER
jgi:hypothetical protein